MIAPGELIKTLVGSTLVGGSTEPEDSLIRTDAAKPAHTVYTMALAPNVGFPTDVDFASIVIRVEEGACG